ncbi:flagellar hook protein FlgE [compost metagenome]
MCLAAMSGCTDDPLGTGTTSTQVAGQAPNSPAQNHPATPPPQVIASPRVIDPTQVATPVPPSPKVTASPAMPGASASPGASPSASASVSPSPGASASPNADTFEKTGVATDLAISGPGYFVLSTLTEPMVLENLHFTRNGHFKVEKDPASAGGVPMARLKHADYDSFYVIGYSHGGTGTSAPVEQAGLSEAVLTTTWDNQPVKTAALILDADRNPEATTKLSFDATGALRIAGSAPRGVDGTLMQAYVAIAQFQVPDNLVPVAGADGLLRYNATVAQMHLGVALTGTSRPVGNANLILTGTLEGGN